MREPGDVFGSGRCDCGGQLDTAMQMIEEAGRGVLLYLRQEGRGIGLANKLHAYALPGERGWGTTSERPETRGVCSARNVWAVL